MKRILVVNEWSELSSGYSTYGKQLLGGLHASGRYEVAELACYASESSPGVHDAPWRVFPNQPEKEDPNFGRDPSNKFGQYTFERVCREFKPSVTLTFRDWWMDEFIERSPYRKFFRWIVMPTVDSAPQMEQWIATFRTADAVFSYTDWGADVLREQGGGTINVVGSASPAADPEFIPLVTDDVRDHYGVGRDDIVIGTVMRNQPRKLYPELFQAFGRFLERTPRSIAERSYLYCHVSYPDHGWDIPELVKHSGFSNRILFTYLCRTCKEVAPFLYQDAAARCPRCGNPTMGLPNVNAGLGRSVLASIYNLFDVYVQYANSEGFGMPMVEAAYCGIPVMATDYSAMSDVVRKVGGVPIKVGRYVTDPDFGSLRALPDNEWFAAELCSTLKDWGAKKHNWRERTATLARRHYDWGKTVHAWMKTIDGLSPAPRSWDEPPRLHTPPPTPPQFASNEELVRWAIKYHLGRPDLVDSYMALRLIKDLNWGVKVETTGGTYLNEQSMLGQRSPFKAFHPEDVFRELSVIREYSNEMERLRVRDR